MLFHGLDQEHQKTHRAHQSSRDIMCESIIFQKCTITFRTLKITNDTFRLSNEILLRKDLEVKAT